MRSNPRRRNIRRGLLAAAAAVALVAGVPTAAHAEGSFTSYINQAQPTFESRTWGDKNLDSVSTKITLTGCKANAAGKPSGSTAVKSVTVELWSTAGKLASIKRACGTYDFGRLGRSTFWFKISEINGYKGADRKIFLDVNTVKVTY